MADEDGERTRPRERGAGEREPRGRDEDAGFGLSLPPISLPEMRFPERIRLVFPVSDPPERVSRPMRVGVSWVLLAVVVADALDALAVVAAGPTALPWVRAAAGLLLSVMLVGGPGLLYAWELLAILGGFGALSLAPTLTVLVLGRIVLSE